MMRWVWLWRCSGDDRQRSTAPFQVLQAAVCCGVLGYGQEWGYGGLPVTNFLRCQWTLSTHASLRVVIVLTAEVSVLGFQNGTSMYCPWGGIFCGWRIARHGVDGI